MKTLLQQRTPPKQDPKLCATEWQEYSRQVIEQFGVKKPYSLKIWRLAKSNLSFLKGKVEYVREIVESRGHKTQDYGAYLISIISKKNI
jgi:hypothetical protein